MLHMVGQKKEQGVQEDLYLYLNVRIVLNKHMSVLIEKPARKGAKFITCPAVINSLSDD
jgi:hypothetical protein